MSIIAAAAARQASTTAVVVNTTAELTRARALADGGIRLGWSAFADGRIEDFDHMWACRNGGDTLLVRLRPETSRIDINVASPDLLAALFEAAGASQQAAGKLAEAAISYRQFGESLDADSSEQVVEGAEEAPVQPDVGQFQPGRFQTIEELGYLPGMDATLFRALVDDVSVHARASDTALRYASANVRKAADAVARAEGLMAGASADAVASRSAREPDAPLPGFEGSLLNVRAIAVTASGAVYVRDAVVEGPLEADGSPVMLRFVQGQLKAGEKVPDPGETLACKEGFTAIRSNA